MCEENSTATIKEFVFVGLTDSPELQIILFVVFLAFYMSTLVGNLGMIALIKVSPQLHTPMYFFLSNLSLLDVCYSSAITPKTLVNLLEDKKSISLIACAVQMYLFIGLGSTECFLLAAMAYDRYVAICKPLLYPVLMTPEVCSLLVVGSYVLGLLHSLVHTVFTFRLSFCESKMICNFFCDISALLSISSSDTYINELLIFYVSGLIEIITILCVLFSYTYILTSIVLRISSVTGRLKAFSTCISHLTVVTIFHGAILIVHFRPKSSSGSELQEVSDKIIAVFYTIVTPLLNPLVYSLRNNEVKDALGVIQRKFCV
ncbi:olfactory receptor 5T17-like [Elgaria multicarinata webbii]|uniref:olfactory receptor 5T17-like n=1 Tax=Elgaria multicarinata webbii TaxID=159646 RepID=UPI002FCD6933